MPALHIDPKPPPHCWPCKATDPPSRTRLRGGTWPTEVPEVEMKYLNRGESKAKEVAGLWWVMGLDGGVAFCALWLYEATRG